MKQIKKTTAFIAALLMISLLCVSCAASAPKAAAGIATGAPQEQARKTADMTGTGEANESGAIQRQDAGAVSQPNKPVVRYVEQGRKIIYEATLQIEAVDYDATCKMLMSAMQQAKGYVSSTSMTAESREGATRLATYTFRIPAENYDMFLAAMGQAGNVTSQQENTQDITAAYVDVEARLKSLRAQEERLLEMLRSTGELETLLAVQQQLTEVQYQLESYTAQQRTYDTLIAYSTITVEVREVKRITETTDTFGQRIGVALRESWIGFGERCQRFAVGFVYALPMLLVWMAVLAAVCAAVFGAWKKHIVRQRKKAQMDASAKQVEAQSAQTKEP